MPCHDLNECLGALNLEENNEVKVKIVTIFTPVALDRTQSFINRMSWRTVNQATVKKMMKMIREIKNIVVFVVVHVGICQEDCAVDGTRASKTMFIRPELLYVFPLVLGNRHVDQNSGPQGV